MKGLVQIPSIEDLGVAYEKLQSRPFDISTGELVLWSQWSRFDPRLAEQLITYFAKNWRFLLPADLNAKLREQPWAAALGVLLFQLQELGNFEKSERTLFSKWADCVMTHVACASGEQFFIGLRSFGGKLMREDAQGSLMFYSKWGYLGREVLINKAQQRVAATNSKKTWMPPRARLAALESLLYTRTRITVRDYREKLHNAVSMRQAELDLKGCPLLRSVGHTRARQYVLRKKRAHPHD
ncbi:hypothetical protein WDW86_16590 [Bdellovibrionota bacterium FG-2]